MQTLIRLLSTAAVALLAAAAAAAAPRASAITSITLEGSCFGCAGTTLLELRRDGGATQRVERHARHGGGEQLVRATLGRAEFARLAQTVVAAGFFEMQEAYQEPGLQDGAWVTLSVACGDEVKQVFRREDAGPPALDRLLAEIERVRSRLAFAADAEAPPRQAPSPRK